MNPLADALVSGVVFNIQKYSVHDGPGIRTNVFLKGCPLRCRWCCNPESQSMLPELGYNLEKCLGCSACVKACAQGALELSGGGLVLDRAACVFEQARCVRACPAQALTVYGNRRTVAEVLNEVEQDSMFYSRSNGGLTLSGGEPLAQPEFALALLREAKRRRIHCAMETSSAVSEATLLEAAGLLDYLLADVKSMNEALHAEYTGVSNLRIIANIRALRCAFPALPVHVRTPVIPGFNDTESEIARIAEFAASIGAVRYELLAYHCFGRQKYKFIGREYPMGSALLDEQLFYGLKALAEGICPPAQVDCARTEEGGLADLDSLLCF